MTVIGCFNETFGDEFCNNCRLQNKKDCRIEIGDNDYTPIFEG